ncbi:hypothetical protein F5B20DRAFT_560861 [Whalleya microplaca]|nr:hypothetical protein F5B20DRAFT_560861 [Whalleya microplaca]
MPFPEIPSAGIDARSLAIDFIDNRMYEYHEAFKNPPTRFDSSLRAYVPIAQKDLQMQTPTSQSTKFDETPRPPPSSLDGMIFWASIFPAGMNDFKTQYPIEPKGRCESGRSIRSLANWNDVYDILEEARQVFESSKGLRGGLKKSLRKFAEYSQPIQQTMALVPNIEYASPVLGALEIITNAAKRSIEVREDVARSLNNLERHFEDIETYLAMFSNDGNIIAASIRLVSSILKAVEEVIGYYTRHLALKTISALFNGAEYQIALTESLEQIRYSSEHLLHQAHSSNMWQNRRVLENTHDNSLKLTKMIDKQQQIADTQNEMKNLLEQLERNLLNERQQQVEIEKLKQHNLYLAAQVSFYRAHTPNNLADIEAAPTSPGSLLTLLNTPQLDIFDVERIMRSKESIPAEDRARAELVLRAPKFHAWTVAPTSRELLVHGDFKGTHYISGLSLFCCSFLQAIRNTGRFYSLVYFCGCHIGSNDAFSGGRGMIKSLVSQLLSQRMTEAGPPGSDINLNLIKVGDIGQLCNLFGWLLRRIPQDAPVFCLVDGIRYYEREQYLEDMAQVLRYLLDLTCDETIQCVFKILITSPSETTIVRQAVDEDSILSMAPQPRTGQKFSHIRFARHMEGQLGKGELE